MIHPPPGEETLMDTTGSISISDTPVPVRFKVYKHHYVTSDNLIIPRQFIVLEYSDGTIRFTDFHKYVRSTHSKVRSIQDDGNSRFAFVTPLLNYAFFERGIRSLDKLTVDIVKDYLNAYGTCTLPDDDDDTSRAKATVERAVSSVLDFLQLLIEDRKTRCSIRVKDLYRTVKKRDKHGKVIDTQVPVFDVKYTGSTHAIFRDMPDKAFRLLFDHILQHHKDMLGLVILSAFCGLRPSEACNVRRTDSPLGPGILIDCIETGYTKCLTVTKIRIDLNHEYNLRSDAVPVGKIKKERMQDIPDIFRDAFIKAYNIYIEYMNNIPYETDYGPFTVNSRHMAMTYKSYYQRFQDIIKDEMIPLYLSSDDPELVTYGKILLEHNISPHIFRHWFTVQLVLSGITDIGTLMHFRGDTSPDSSLTYLKNKGELERKYTKINDELFDYHMWAAERGHGDGKP